ncbi:MAG: helix-turn-helix domain-containing protein [Peptococcaceae bacterium]|nr:helix-turn-helix domain-containing protein [Peptococcaceae bacterium]
MDLGKRILLIRKKMGLSQEDFAVPLGVNRSHIAGIESGARCPSAHLIKLICCYYHVNEKWLRHGEGDMFVAPEQFLQVYTARFGRQAVLDACRNILEGKGEDPDAVAQGQAEADLTGCRGGRAGAGDEELNRMINVLKLIWLSGDQRLRHWASVQFDRAFPEDMIESARKKLK